MEIHTDMVVVHEITDEHIVVVISGAASGRVRWVKFKKDEWLTMSNGELPEIGSSHTVVHG